MSPRTYTTREAAEDLGITRATLQEWIAAGKVKNLPKLWVKKGLAVRVWTREDVARLRRVKEIIYRKGRGRKKKKKA